MDLLALLTPKHSKRAGRGAATLASYDPELPTTLAQGGRTTLIQDRNLDRHARHKGASGDDAPLGGSRRDVRA